MEVGTTVKADDEPDVYAILNALSTQDRKVCLCFVLPSRFLCSACNPASAPQPPAVGIILDYLMKKCPKKKRAQFRAALSNKRTALLLNERMINMPAQIAPSLHKCFVDDLEWAVKQPGNVRSPLWVASPRAVRNWGTR